MRRRRVARKPRKKCVRYSVRSEWCASQDQTKEKKTPQKPGIEEKK